MNALSARRKVIILISCCVSLLIVSMDATIVNVAIPSIRTELHASASELQWVIDVYTLVLASLLLLSGLVPFDDLGKLLNHSDIVFSICPPHGALEVARQLADFRGIVLDANAISPETSVLIGRTVTGDDGEVASLFDGSALEVVRLAGAPPAASALKMTYAAWTKTTAALLVSIRRTAAAYGVDDDLVNEWAISQPQLAGAWLQARQQSHEKGWRWSYELAEVGRTFAAVGQPEGFGAAASEVFATSSAQ